MTNEEFDALLIGHPVRIRYRYTRYGTVLSKEASPWEHSPDGFNRLVTVRIRYNSEFATIKNTTQQYGIGWLDICTDQRIVYEFDLMRIALGFMT